MKIRLIKIGRVKKEFKDLIETYQQRLKTFSKIEIVEYKNNSIAKKNILEFQSKENGLVICLNEKGKQVSSQNLADEITNYRSNSTIKYVNYIVGDPYGLPREITDIAQSSWSLSKLTFPSDIAWLLLVEQIYRAFNIIQGTPYHHE